MSSDPDAPGCDCTETCRDGSRSHQHGEAVDNLIQYDVGSRPANASGHGVDDRTESEDSTESGCLTTSPEYEASGYGVPDMPDLGLGWTTDDLDDDWEARARAHLSDVDADTDLGVEIARDAMRVGQGELSKAAFHEKHHEPVEEEFGVDDRPTASASRKRGSAAGEDAGSGGSILGSAGGGSSRRNVLKAAGGTMAAGATAGLAGCLGVGEDVAAEPTGQRMGMAIDTNACIACLKCVEACKEENDTDRGAHWMHVFRYVDPEFDDEEADEGYMPRPCMHCSEPSCAYVCPTQARHQRSEDGLVLTDYDTCIGCKYCQVACPYGVNFLSKNEPHPESTGFRGEDTADGRSVGGPPPAGVMGKCTFCVHRQEDEATRGTTACEESCPVDAIHFGDLSDRESPPRQYIREHQDENRFKLLDDLGNEPNVHYIGRKPSKNARSTDGPFTYEDVGLKKLGPAGGEHE